MSEPTVIIETDVVRLTARIAELEAALRDIAYPSKRNDECEQLKRLARKALEAK